MSCLWDELPVAALGFSSLLVCVVFLPRGGGFVGIRTGRTIVPPIVYFLEVCRYKDRLYFRLLVSIAGSRGIGTLWFWDHIRGHLLVSMVGSRDVGTFWFWDHIRGYLFVSIAGFRDIGTLWFWDHVRGYLLASVAGTRDFGFEISLFS